MNHKLFLLMPDLCYSWVLMKTANLSLEIAILVQIGVLIWSLNIKHLSGSLSLKSCSKLYSIVVMCLCLCEMHVSMVMCNYVLSSWATEQNVWPKNTSLLKNFRRIPQETKILYHKQFSQKSIQQWIFPNYGISESHSLISAIVCFRITFSYTYMHCILYPPLESD